MNKLSTYLIFLILGTWVTCAVLLASPSDPKNAIAFGYSLELIFIAASLILFTIPLLYVTWKLLKNPQHALNLEHYLINNNLFYFLTFVSSIIFLLLILVPSYRLGVVASYISRLYPILIWFTLISLVTLHLFIHARKTEVFWSIITEDKKILQVTFINLVILFLILTIIIFTGIGVRQPEDYWFGAGVPVLAQQVLLAMFVAILFKCLELRREIKNIDLILCASLFTVTAFLWARGPVLPNYFMPDTAKNVMYPYSDSATFDMGSQFALIGQGLFSYQFFDRALYSSFLTYLHLFWGQDIQQIMIVQAIIFSVFPVVMYLIGKELHSRAFGIAFGLLISLRGLNAILSATWIDLASPKMMTTDFPTAIGISLFLLFAIKWFKDTSKIYFVVLAGGALGLNMMLRTHVLFLAIAFIFFFLIIRLNIKWNVRWVVSLVFIFGMLTATTPWDLRNLRNNGTPMFYLYYSRIQTILEERYNINESSLPIYQNISRQRMLQRDESGCDGQVCKIANHFFHNTIASFLFLPSSFMFDGLWNTVKEGAPYWQIAWTGSGISFSQWFFIIINFVLLSLGIGLAWRQKKWLGIFPLWIFLAYISANSLAFTSAGRYVAPVDWIICFYYLLGVFQIMLWILRLVKILPKVGEQVEVKNEAKIINYRQAVWAFGLVFLLGSLVPISEMFFEKRYEVREPQLILEDLEQNGLLNQSEFSQTELLEFLSQPQAMIVEGRALYPRYYRMGEGEPDRSTYYRYLDFSRLVFTVIGPYSPQAQGVVIAGDKPSFSIHTSDVIVFGCWNTTYYAPFIDAVVVFINSEEGSYVYQRLPEHPLQCPLQEPRQ